MSHYPVMLNEVLAGLRPQAGEVHLDGTFGAGGYSRAVLGAADCALIAVDRDPNVAPTVEQFHREFGERFSFHAGPFSELERAVSGSDREAVNGVVLDIGVSSMQIDQAERGFSFSKPGPLDMRMSGEGASASDAVNRLSERELADIFYVYGEERKSRRVAQFVVRARGESPITTTDQLAGIVSRAIGGKHLKIHPATRVFQALRIFVNDELGELARALSAAERVLAPMGRLVVVTFHSLEDRMVKTFMRARSGLTGGGGSRHNPVAVEGPAASFTLETRKAVTASEQELSENPRSRSAKLRVAVRNQAPSWQEEEFVMPGVVPLSKLEAAL